MSVALLGRQKCCCGCGYFSAVPSSPAEGQVTFSDALGSMITVESGTWDIDGSNRLRVTGPGKIIIEPPQPDGLPMYAIRYLAAGTPGTNTGKAIKLYIDYLDGSNHHFAEASPQLNPWTYPSKVARVVSGTETVIGEGAIAFTTNSNFDSSTGGAICIQDSAINVRGPWPELWNSSTIQYSAVNPTTPVGGLKAAIEVLQGPSETYIFSSVDVYKQSSEECPLPLNYCGTCMTVPGCHTIPTGGFMVTLSGITSGAFPVGDNCTAAAQFNGSFTLDEFGVFNVGHRQPGIGFPGPGGGMFHTGRVRGWRSAVFELTSVVSCNALGFPVTFTHGRIVLEPLGYTGYATGSSPSSQTCKTGFRVHMIAGNTPASENYLDWRWLGVLGPVWPNADNPEGAASGDGAIVSAGNEVMFACETIDGATFSGGGQATPFDTTDASFTVDAL